MNSLTDTQWAYLAGIFDGERKEYEELTKQRLTIMNQRGTSYA